MISSLGLAQQLTALHTGFPQVICPFFADKYFWAARAQLNEYHTYTAPVSKFRPTNGINMQIFNIRKASVEDATGIAEVQGKSRRTTYKGIISKKALDSLRWEDSIASWRQRISTDDRNIFVATVDEKIVGYIHGGKCRSSNDSFDAELYALYLLKEFQRMGIGARLFTRLIKGLKTQNYSSMLIWVAKENTYQAFYQKMGAKLTDIECPHPFAGESITCVAYRWEAS